MLMPQGGAPVYERLKERVDVVLRMTSQGFQKLTARGVRSPADLLEGLLEL